MNFILLLTLLSPPERTLAVLQTELLRNQKDLSAANPAPYFIGYAVSDVEYVQVSASNGAIESASHNRAAWMDVSVRVGSYDLDNTHRVPGENNTSFQLPLRGPIEGEAEVLSRSIGRATQRIYREAARTYLRVKTAKDVRLEGEDKSPDFARPAPPDITPCHALTPATLGDSVDADIETWKSRLREWSELFRRERHIQNSHITLSVRAATRYTVSSDGLCNMEPSILFRVGLLGEGKAEDGMDLNRFESFEARTAAELPSTAQVAARIAIMSADLKALENAPVLEPYSGPAILSGRAAAVFFHEALGHRVEGPRQREVDSGQTFTRKVGESVLPSFINVVDDPTMPQFGATKLMGAYHFDDEGIRSERVTVAERGTLRNFLMSRTPVRGFTASNGHGRAEPGQTPVGRQGNLVVTSDRTVSRERLRKMLIDEVKKRHKPYGLLFGDVEGGYTLTHRFVAQVFQVFPLMVWRVYPDGRPDELVRGAELVGTPLVTLGKIAAAGDDPQVFNGYCGAESGFIPVSAIAPSLLISEMEVQKKARSYERPPLLAPPEPGTTPQDVPKDDAILSAMSGEMKRTMRNLRLGELERPYFAEYRAADVARVEAAASLGALTEFSQNSYRPLTVGVRVGDPSLDNTNFISTSDAGAGTGAAEQFTVSLDPNYDALRQDLWIATDQAYKHSLSSLAAKRAYLQTATRDDALPDFAPAPPASARLLGRIEMPRDAATACAAMAQAISAHLAGKDGVRDSSVRVVLEAANQYYLNSEGTFSRRPILQRVVRAWATASTPDGLRMRGGFADLSLASQCSAGEAAAFGERLERSYNELMAAARAEQAEEYVGPVLVEPDAAAQVFATLLPAAIVGRKAVLTDNPVATDTERDFSTLNGRVLPSGFNVSDNPAVPEFDDEGVKPLPVRVIEKGILKRWLSTRVPVKTSPESNGHARAAAGGPAVAAPFRLTVEADTAVSMSELKTRLRALCRERGLAYGLLLSRFQTAGSVEDLSADDLMDPSMELTLGGTGRGGAALQPLTLWRVYADDGREERVRGLRLADLRLGALKQIIAAGSDTGRFQGFYTPPSTFTIGMLSAGMGDGLPLTVTAPAVLFDELEFRRQRRAP